MKPLFLKYPGKDSNFHDLAITGLSIIDDYKKTHEKIKWNTKIDNRELTQLVKDFYKKTFYGGFKIDEVLNGSLQEIIFDWCVNSGVWGARGVQRVLNQFFDADLKMDGIIGNQTLSAINDCDPRTLFIAIHRARVRYYHSISKKGKNHLFLEGWLKRIGAIEYVS